MQSNDEPIVVEQSYAVSRERLWQAITDPQEMKKWFFDVLPDFKAEVGFETSFTLTNEGRVFPHNWKVISVESHKTISVQWTFDGYPGVSLVNYEIEGNESESKLVLTAKATEDHPQDIPEFKRESGVGGWNYFLKEALLKHLQ